MRKGASILKPIHLLEFRINVLLIMVGGSYPVELNSGQIATGWNSGKPGHSKILENCGNARLQQDDRADGCDHPETDTSPLISDQGSRNESDYVEQACRQGQCRKP